MKIVKMLGMLISVVMVTACGRAVDVGPAEVGKIITKDGYQEGLRGTSKFRLPFCVAYCDKLVTVDISDKTVTESMTLFMPEDKLKMGATVQATLSINPTKIEPLFGTLTPQERSDSESYIPVSTVYKTYAQNLVLTQTREYLTQYSIAELASSLDKVNADLRNILSEQLQTKTPFLVRNVGITNIEYPSIITEAQENAAKRREMIQQEEAQLEISKVQLERELKEAQLQRQIDYEKAQGEAAAQKLQSQVVDSKVLQLRKLENERMWIEKWDGKLPVTAMGEAVPMVSIGK